MTYPSSDVITTNVDAGTDSPALARADVLDLITKFNQLRNHIGTLGQTLLNRATAALMRADLGVAPRATRIDVASVAGAVNLTTAAPDTDDIRLTGALAITSFTVAVGRDVSVVASGASTLTNNASILTNTGANIVCAAGDSYVLRATAANTVEVLHFTRAVPAVLTTGAQTVAGAKTFTDALTALTVSIPTTTAGVTMLAAGSMFQVAMRDSLGYSLAASVAYCGRDSTSGRALNAGGTVNASGADYAEYMRKAVGCGTIAKGQIIGINSAGEITDQWADSVAFAVKSTDPSYVGGDVWGTPEALGIAVDSEAFAPALEAERQKYDRIAFAGQVPVNVSGATTGSYIIPVQDGPGISGLSVASPNLAQYMSAVGKVITIEPDGRPRVIVKVS